MSDKYLLAIRTMTEEQYNTYFKNLPIPYSVIKSNPQQFIETMSNNNDVLKKLLKNCWKNNIQLVNVVTSNENFDVTFNININNEIEKKFAKQINEKLNLNGKQFSIKGKGKGIFQINVSINQLKGILDFNNLVDNYFSLNKNPESIPYDEINPKLLEEVIQQYSKVPEDIIDLILNENQKEVAHIIEKDKEKNNFINPRSEKVYLTDVLQDNVDMEYIHSLDPIYKDVSFSKMTEDMKKTMCNRYFQMVFNEKLNNLQTDLSESSKTKIQFSFHQQPQKNSGLYGISGNTEPFDEKNNITKLDIYSNSKLEYFELVEDKVKINEDLLGQAMITILHEYRHAQQQQAIRDNIQNNKLVNAIKEFETKCESDSNYYENNYKEDPAEIDANFYSFSELKRIGLQYGINNPEKIILDRTEHIRQNADDTNRIYESKFESYEDVMMFLRNKLQSELKPVQQKETLNKKEDNEIKQEENEDKNKQEEKAKTKDEVQINKDIKNAVENKESQSLDDIQTLRHGSIADLDSQYIIGDKEKGIPKHYLKVNEDGSWYEKWEYFLKENSDNGIGYQTITENWDSNKETKTIVTESELENKDGKYTISEISEGNNDSYSVQKIVKGYNKRTGNNEQFFYAKDKQGNEFAYSKINGNISLRVSKNKNGTTIDKYDEKGQVIDSYTYDKEGKALIGFNGLDEISEDYVEKFIERVGKNIPQVYAEGVDLGTHENNQPILENKGETARDREEEVSTQKLGEETLDIQKSHKRMDDVENVVNQHRAERQQPTKEATTEYDKTNFKDRMKVHINSDEYVQEVLTKFEQDLENGTLDKKVQKNNDDYNPDKGDDDYVM